MRSRHTTILTVALIGCAWAGTAFGWTPRYALVVGSNRGRIVGHARGSGPSDHPSVRSKHTERWAPPLKHAHNDARKIETQLLTYGLFDHARVKTVTGATRRAVYRAADELAAMAERDRRVMGDRGSLFVLFFHGHGLEDQLLTEDRPLTSQDVRQIIAMVGAKMNVGVFDTCRSGSLRPASNPQAPGAIDRSVAGPPPCRVDPGFRPDLAPAEPHAMASAPPVVTRSPAPGSAPPIRTKGASPISRPTLTESLLAVAGEGTLFYTSTDSTGDAIEHGDLGGLFTHYFVESFVHADAGEDGVIEPPNMFEYARDKTVSKARELDRQQFPCRIPSASYHKLPFSFPTGRSVAVRMSREVQPGPYVLRYINGLSTILVKGEGKPLEVRVPSGELDLRRPSTAGPASTHHRPATLSLPANATLWIEPEASGGPLHTPGYRWSITRGAGAVRDLSFHIQQTHTQLLTGIGYRQRPSIYKDSGLLGAKHFTPTLSLWWVRDQWSTGFDVAYGPRQARFDTWRYDLDEMAIRALVAYALPLGAYRLNLAAGLGVTAWRVSYNDERPTWGAGLLVDLGLKLRLPVPLRAPWIVLEAGAAVDVRTTRSIVAAHDSRHGSAAPLLELSVLVPWSVE